MKKEPASKKKKFNQTMWQRSGGPRVPASKGEPWSELFWRESLLAIHASRQEAPDESSSCGSQPAHIRMIIVAAAKLAISLPLRSN
jgi:hypothetical protein